MGQEYDIAIIFIDEVKDFDPIYKQIKEIIDKLHNYGSLYILFRNDNNIMSDTLIVKLVYNDKLIVRERIIFTTYMLFTKDYSYRGTILMNNNDENIFNNSTYVAYHIVKRQKYNFNLDAVRVPLSIETIKRATRGIESKKLTGEQRGFTVESKKKYHQKILSKYLQYDIDTRSMGGRLAKIIASGETDKVVLVREAITNVNAYLKQKLKESGLTIKQLSKLTGIKETTLSHYFRTDLSGASLPPREVWEILKPILNLDEYEEHIKEEYKSVIPSPNPKGANPPNVILIDNVNTLEEFRNKIVEFLTKATCYENCDIFIGTY